jgi:hypothetical protein
MNWPTTDRGLEVNKRVLKPGTEEIKIVHQFFRILVVAQLSPWSAVQMVRRVREIKE